MLADALGITGGRVIRGDHRYFTSVVARDWVPPRAETRVAWLQEIDAPAGRTVLADVASGRPCGVEVERGAGRAVVWAAGLPSDPRLFRAAAERLGATPGLTHDPGVPPGLFATTTADADGGRLVHLLNVSGYPCETPLWLDGEPLFGGRELRLPPRTGRMLPAGLRLPAATIRWSTAEITGSGPDSVSFAAPAGDEVVVVETLADVRADAGDVHRSGDLVTVTARGTGSLTLTFGPSGPSGGRSPRPV